MDVVKEVSSGDVALQDGKPIVANHLVDGIFIDIIIRTITTFNHTAYLMLMQTSKRNLERLNTPDVWDILKNEHFDMYFLNTLNVKINSRFAYLYQLNNISGTFLRPGNFIVNNKMRYCLYDNRFSIKEPTRFQTDELLTIAKWAPLITLKDSMKLVNHLHDICQLYQLKQRNCGYRRWVMLQTHGYSSKTLERFVASYDDNTINIERLQVFKKTEISIEYIILLEYRVKVGWKTYKWMLQPYITKIKNISY